MNILIVEPFFTGSHKRWALEYQAFSRHQVKILSLPGRHWKWRMHGAAVSLAKAFRLEDFKPDLIIASDMLDLSTFLALVRDQIQNIPIALYFHENQITYPWSPDDPDKRLDRNNQYGFINYTSALCADRIYFNSSYHLYSFTNGLDAFLKQFPDHRELDNIDRIRSKSEQLYLGMDLKKFDKHRSKIADTPPVLLWNHRWEYDKNPGGFYEALQVLKKEQLDFRAVILGESYSSYPVVFDQIKSEFEKQVLHFGFAESFDEYAHWLWQADILPVSSNQDFFGGSVVEAMYCNCIPLLPDRLAYPEHIPPGFRDQHLYKDTEDFHQKLKELIRQLSDTESRSVFSDFVARYDWSILAAYYDQTFQNSVDAYHSIRTK